MRRTGMDKVPTHAELDTEHAEVSAGLQYAVEELKMWLHILEVRIVQLEKYVPQMKKERRDNAPPADQPRRRGKEHMYKEETR